MFDEIFKIIIFGDAGSGKTTLRKRFINDVFLSNSHQTIGVDFETKILEMNGKEIKLLIGDFAGDKRFRYMFPQYIYGAVGGILLYDITDYSSFSHISDWLLVIRRMNQRFPIILLGSKLDLDDCREISFSEGVEAAKSNGMKGFTECSSKTGENVEETFVRLTKIIVNRMITTKNKIQCIRV